MRNFFQIGLPWAISLGIVFFIGLELGSRNKVFLDSQQSAQQKLESPVIGVRTDDKKTKSSTNLGSPDTEKNSLVQRPLTVTYSPPLPPNLRRIMVDGSLVERMGAYMDALRGMDVNSVSEVVNAFEALPKGFGRHLEMKLLMRSWAKLDPLEALKYAENSLNDKSEHRFAISEVIAGWAVYDPSGATSFVNQYQDREPDSKNITNLMVGVVKGLAENDLSEANNFFLTIPEGDAKWQASTFLAQEYANLEINEAIQWAEKFPDDDEKMKKMVLGHLGAKLAQKDLEATARWAESMPANDTSEQVVSNLLSKWISQNPQQAANWASQINDSDKRVQAMKVMTKTWAIRDPVATAGWLNNFPPSAELDPVVSEFVNRIATRDPEGAVGWASSIVNKAEKQKALGHALKAWDRKNPKEASDWRSNNGLLRREE